MRVGMWLGNSAVIAAAMCWSSVALGQGTKTEKESVQEIVEITNDALTATLESVQECNGQSVQQLRNKCFEMLERDLTDTVREAKYGLGIVQSWIRKH